jgi:hypothetical protein
MGGILSQPREATGKYKHSTKPGRVTLAGRPRDDLPPGTLNSIMKQAGLKERGE